MTDIILGGSFFVRKCDIPAQFQQDVQIIKIRSPAENVKMKLLSKEAESYREVQILTVTGRMNSCLARPKNSCWKIAYS